MYPYLNIHQYIYMYTGQIEIKFNMMLFSLLLKTSFLLSPMRQLSKCMTNDMYETPKNLIHSSNYYYKIIQH